jgi:hypothetical protein
MSEEENETQEPEEEKHYIVLTDEDGHDTKVQLLFSIVYHETGEQFIYVVDPENEDAVLIFRGDAEGNLEMVTERNTDEKTMAFLHDTFQAYLVGDLEPVGEEGEEDEDDDCDDPDCSCHHHHHHHPEFGEEREVPHHHAETECCEGDECCCASYKEEKK